MKTETKIQNLREKYPQTIIMNKIGSFYHAYGNDAYILSYQFDYQLKSVQGKPSTCGFPVVALDKVLSKLDSLGVNYAVSEGNQEDEISKYKKFEQNKYIELQNHSHAYIRQRDRIDNIHQFLLEGISAENLQDKLIKIEEIVYK